MTEDRSGFRAVLHEWARRQLCSRAGHFGPFEITDVHVDHVRGYGSPETPADDEVWVRILFNHPGECPGWGRPEWPCPPVNGWSMPDTTTTVEMLNELLALANKP
jgi:hypothetical protein